MYRSLRSPFLIVAASVALVCCGLSTVGTGGDDTFSLDASGDDAKNTPGNVDADGSLALDGAGADAISDTGADAISDAGADAISDADAGALSDADGSFDAGPVGMFHCPTTDASVTDCSACSGNPLECVLCGGPAPRTFCTSGRICNGSQTVSNWCPCAGGDAAACPFGRHACYAGINGGICLTCGEQNATDQYTCHDGKTCSAFNYVCQ